MRMPDARISSASSMVAWSPPPTVAGPSLSRMTRRRVALAALASVKRACFAICSPHAVHVWPLDGFRPAMAE